MKVHLYYKNLEDLNKNYAREMNEMGIKDSMQTSVSTIFVKGEGNPQSPIVVRINNVPGGEIFTSFIKK